MQTYISSSIYSIRLQGHLSYSFNDYSYVLNERFDRNPVHSSLLSTSKSCCCCDGCGISTQRLPINPCYLYGLRQSSLLQWSACKRLILGGRGQCNYRLRECSTDYGCYELPCSIRERSVCNRRGRRRKGRCCVVDAGDESECYDDLDDAEAMLSLLSEELGEEWFCRRRKGLSFKKVEAEGGRHLSGGDRNASSSKRVEEERRSFSGRERNVGSSKRIEAVRRTFGGRDKNRSSSKGVQVEIEGNNSSEYSSGKKKIHGRLSSSERNSKHQFESARENHGRLSSSGRNSRHQFVSATESDGRSSSFEMNLKHQFESATESHGRLSSLGRNSKHQFESATERNGRLSSSERNSRHQFESAPGSHSRFSSLERNSKHQFEPATIRLSEGESRQKEERELLLRGENYRGRKGGSSSSYYSLSSSGDFGSEIDVQDKPPIFEELAPSKYKDSKSDRGRIDGQVIEDYRKSRGDSEEYRASRHTAVEGGVMWDRRNETEKKITEIEDEEAEADGKSSEMHTRMLKTNQSELGKASSSHKPFDDVQGNSNLTKRTKQQYNHTGDQVVGVDVAESRRKFQARSEIPETCEDDVDTASWSQKRLRERENLAISTNLVQETRDESYKRAEYISQREDFNRELHSRTSQIRVVDAENTSDWQRHSNTRRIYQEENTNILLTSMDETEFQRHQVDQQIIEKINLRRKPQQVTEVSEIGDSVERANIIQPVIIIKNQLGHSNLVPTSSGESSQPCLEIDEKACQRIQLRKGTDGVTDVTDMSHVHLSNTETYTTSQRISKKRTFDQDSDMILAAISDEETRQNNETSEQLMQVISGKEARSSKQLSECHEKDSREASSFQASLSMVSEAGTQPHGVDGPKRNPQAMLLPPPSQFIARGSLDIESSSGMATQVVSGEIPDTGSLGKQTSCFHPKSYGGSGSSDSPGDILYLIPEDALGSTYRLEKSSAQVVRDLFQKVRLEVSTSENQNESSVSEPALVYDGEEYGRGTSTSLQESSSGNGNSEAQGENLYLINPEGALDSAYRLEELSAQFVREFSEKVRQEVSTSENLNTNTISEAKLVQGVVKHGERDSSQNGSEDFQKKENGSTRSSGGSGSKGPSIEMWDVVDTPAPKTPKGETSEATTTSGTAIVKRTGRSIWNIVADIVRLRWSSHGDTARSSVKSGGRTSSVESASSEDKNEENGKRDKDMQSETSSDQLQPGTSFSQSQEETLGMMSSKDQVRHLEVGTPSSNKEESGLTPQAVSLSSGEERLSSKEYQKSFQGSSGIKKVEASQPLVATGIRSPVIEELSSEFGGQNLKEVSGNMQKGGELKQRRMQRNKQVLRDRFDEWEEAHTLEIEQRKMDEMFMREALVEAKKAADTWEVPVGAVLVQQGKIIARGYNLVEELRDSTAHAEMICIREASNHLRSWRLADATLYVTLEPCPMCAGAILQARIDTVVWGAPNKLLGADGSWIRLFPDANGGNSSEQSDKPAPPVHPFHPNMSIRRGVLASECADIMQQFFQLRRKMKLKQAEPIEPSCRSVSHHPSKLLTKVHDIFHMMFCL